MTIEGLSELKSKIESLKSQAIKKMEEAATDASKIGERYTKQEAPVLTGNLRDSYGTRLETKLETEVMMRTGSDVKYAPFQELGTFKMRGKAHLRPGFSNEAEMVAAAEAKLKEIL